MNLKALPLASLIFVLQPLTVYAQEKVPAQYFTERLPQGRQVPSGIANGAYREAFIFRVMSEFRIAAGEDRVLRQDDVARVDQVAAAAYRSRVIQMISENDINGDGTVSKEEIRQAWAAKHATAMPEQLLNGFLTADLDGDGRITADEATRFAREKQAKRPVNAETVRQGTTPILSHVMGQMMALDPNGDGNLTGNEFEELGRRAFAHYDKDGDGILTAEESGLIPTTRQPRTGSARTNAGGPCEFPSISASTRLTYISAYEAGTLSNVTVVGQDRETEVADLVIGGGNAPLQIYATAYTPMIWRVSGAVERVERFVTTNGENATSVGAVAGLPKDRVSFVRQGCIPRIRDEMKGADPSAMVQAVAGREATQVISAYNLHELSPGGRQVPRIPDSADVTIKRNEPKPLESYGDDADRSTYHSMIRFSPGGLAEVDPATVVGSSPAERYVVAPQEAGLMQLMADGSLSREGRGFLVKRPIPRFPAGLNGAHGVTFVLAEGVPMPEGSPGHSRVHSHDGTALMSPDIRLERAPGAAGSQTAPSTTIDPFANL